MVKIRLQRQGKKRAPFYHIVVADSKSPRDGKIIEQIGTYDPMTKQEKRNTKLLNGSRRLRIAKGSGTTVQDVNKFMKSFEMTQKMMKQLKSNKGGMKKMMQNMNMNELGKLMK